MRTAWEWILDEKVVTCVMIIFFSLICLMLIKWGVDKEYISIFGGGVTALTGSLLRGITHTIPQTDSTQTVATVTTVTPKEEVKP